MHIEFLIEDSSGEKLLQTLLPMLLGEQGAPHTWRALPYKGVGRIRKDLAGKPDPVNRMLLDNLPRLLCGYGRTPGIGAVVVILDSDHRDSIDLLKELQALANACHPAPKTLFRLATEEIEAWYFGDRLAIVQAYPKAKIEILNRYTQDAICGTWELLADAIYPGGSAALKKAGWPLPGQIKHEWAEKIGPLLMPDNNQSPSFCNLRDGLRQLIGSSG